LKKNRVFGVLLSRGTGATVQITRNFRRRNPKLPRRK
jgi:hypothetical protein